MDSTLFRPCSRAGLRAPCPVCYSGRTPMMLVKFPGFFLPRRHLTLCQRRGQISLRSAGPSGPAAVFVLMVATAVPLLRCRSLRRLCCVHVPRMEGAITGLGRLSGHCSRPRGYTPHGHIGVDGGRSSGGASTGVARTRRRVNLLLFFLSFQLRV